MDVRTIQLLGKALNNPYRLSILRLCGRPHNISEVQKHIGISYKTTYNHVKELERAKLVKTKVHINQKGKNVMVESLISIEGNVLKGLE